jgi:hypothetical protein
MFNSVGAFNQQFKPVDDGYLYYPSKSAGGKLVTAEEYEALTADWERRAGRSGTWRSAGVIGLAILVWALLSQSLALPGWTDWLIIAACAASLTGWLFWASSAPRRLVRGRPDAAPPRSASQVRREILTMRNWPFVIFALLLTGAVFAGALISLPWTIAGWAWVIGSGLLFAIYLRVAIKKLSDPQG